MLTLEDNQSLNLSAELVVLSFDDTATGQITGDGLIGLPRAFRVAGVPTAIAALWLLNDHSTPDLMLEFDRQLQPNPHPAQALRQAMLFIRQQYPSPKDWAVFTVIGASQ